MDRCALFVDAAYLYAAGGKLCCDTTKREELELEFGKAIEVLRDVAAHASDLPVLRVYWYDAAKDAVPTSTHIRVAELQGVQLRLGRLTYSGQKGVDSRIIRDLIVLSRNHAIADALLLSGDDDLREGVTEAQDYGVAVTLVGVEPLEGLQNQAPTLIRAVDATITLTKAQVSGFLRGAQIDEAELRAARDMGARFAGEWGAQATPENVRAVIATKPKLPPALYGDLIRLSGPRFGLLKGKPLVVRALLEGFWKGFLEKYK